jgi:hypothetical protein
MVVISRRKNLAGHVAWMGGRSAYRDVAGKLEGKALP